MQVGLQKKIISESTFKSTFKYFIFSQNKFVPNFGCTQRQDTKDLDMATSLGEGNFFIKTY